MTQQVLVLAMTKMLSGVCTAGFLQERDDVTGLRWVRPVKEHGALLLGDLTAADGRVIRCFDVVEMALQRERPDPPHLEDWTADFVRHRPRVLRRLEDEPRARLLADCLDQQPQDVLVEQRRSLCLIRPETVRIRFSLDRYSGKFDARISFTLAGAQFGGPKGLAVTDLKWRALGYDWLGDAGGVVVMEDGELREKLGLEDLYLAVGLSRNYRGQLWTLVIGVHTVPDYLVEINYGRL